MGAATRRWIHMAGAVLLVAAGMGVVSAIPAAAGNVPPRMPFDLNPGAHKCWLPPMPPTTPCALPITSASSPAASPVQAR